MHGQEDQDLWPFQFVLYLAEACLSGLGHHPGIIASIIFLYGGTLTGSVLNEVNNVEPLLL
jgi:hypothetical protein